MNHIYKLFFFVTYDAGVFVSGKPFHTNLMFASNPRAYPIGAVFGCSALGQAPSLIRKHLTRIGCKSLPGTNTSGYLTHLKITVKNTFVNTVLDF
jgi:hypothetical protein